MNRIAAFLTTVALFLNYIFGLGSVSVSGGFELVKTQRLNPFVSMYSAQGLCCDGEYFYCSGALTAVNFTGLAKFDLDMNCIKVKSGCIPKEFQKKYGSNHIGGIDCANGYIYAPVEGKGYLYNFILLYECETLKFTGIYYDLTSKHLTDGIPWCAIDRENGFLYTSMFDPVDEILQYDLKTMQLIRAIPLSEQIHRIQGGSVYNGMLYLSFDCKNPGTREEVLCVNPANGKVNSLFVREMPNYDNEAEDICVYPLTDGTLFHTVDYDKLISANVLHFKQTD